MFQFAALFTVLFFSLSPVQADEVYRSQEHDFKLVPITEDLSHPWGLAFLPNGDMLITERDKPALRLLSNGQLHPKPIIGLPDHIKTSGQGGLLDVTLHPDFEQNRLIYFSYAGSQQGRAGTEVARAKLVNHRLEHLETIFSVTPKTGGSAHYGSRLQFDKNGLLYITVGDRYNLMNEAQNPANHLGSIMRITDDGGAPMDNPFAKHPTYRPEIFSFGHRNPQGLTMRPSDGTIWAHEHGPRGGDEVNKLKAGANYGWPAITYGIDYSGATISDKTHLQGMEQPIVYWDPSIAPSGMEFYDATAFPNWQGNLFVGALAQRHLRRLVMQGDQVVEQEVLLKGFARIRDIKTGPDGFIYILTDHDNGGLYRLEPLS
ncbi:MAG: PQQ-dependent sugar dehydrogenase [Methylocystaceae bacterium]|nr:PQQ-dependent sugar dehydrogenase [Methylocystaceae bacterium]